MTKEQLERYPQLFCEVVALQEEVLRKQQSNSLAVMVGKETTEARLGAVLAEMETIHDAISNVHNPLERSLLDLRYLNGENGKCMSWPEVAFRLYGGCESKHITAVHRLHKRALASIAAG